MISLEENFNISKENIKGKNLNENDLCSMNLFGFQKKTLNYLSEAVNNFKEDHKNDPKIECLLPQEINNLIKDKKITMNLYSTNEKWFGLTRPEDVEIVKKELKKL